MALVSPIDAYGAANNDDSGFVGWANYRSTKLGLHAEDSRVEVWTVDGSVEGVVDAGGSPNEFLDELDELLRS